MQKMTFPLHSLVIIDDRFFADYKNAYLMDNKHEGRPYYLAVKEDGDIIWVVPLSSKVDNYAAKIDRDERKYGKCLYYYICTVSGKKRVFLIGNMIPVHRSYIKRPYTINEQPYVIQNEKDVLEIKKRVGQYLALIRNRKLRPNVDVLSLRTALIDRFK